VDALIFHQERQDSELYSRESVPMQAHLKLAFITAPISLAPSDRRYIAQTCGLELARICLFCQGILLAYTRLGFPLTLVTISNARAGSMCKRNTAAILRSEEERHLAAGYQNTSWHGCFRTNSTTLSLYCPHVTGLADPVLQW
jgi:hypothetical protein